jgi:hypothetical protein
MRLLAAMRGTARGLTRNLVAVAWAVAWAAPGAGVAAAERQLTPIPGPEAVFDEPVDELMPELAGAIPTGENGNVGSELAFWGYRLADGRSAFFFACAASVDVDCTERMGAICTTRATVLRTTTRGGNIVHRRCNSVAVTPPGNVRPGCVDEHSVVELDIGLITCV